MKNFTFKADIVFKAESVTDALALLRNHFDACIDGTDGPAWFAGQFEIEPENELVQEFKSWPGNAPEGIEDAS